ncbi:MAG: hypothetical protein HY074_14800 [Deltaproteobacteria bacterium]|nr:hypothetical protein [Deltaproteobacteria bacterium]
MALAVFAISLLSSVGIARVLARTFAKPVTEAELSELGALALSLVKPDATPTAKIAA